MHRPKPISETQEMYLKTLYNIRGIHDVSQVRDLAAGLGLHPATVSSMLKKLERMRLVDHERYGLVALTSTGSKIAQCVVRKYETIRDVLVEVFGVDSDTAALDACMMEHGASAATIHRMEALLEQARDRKVDLPKRLATRSADDPCARCEALDSCQAMAGISGSTR